MSERPIFVVGAPRSGTTLLKFILDGHPRIIVGRELNIPAALAPRWWRPGRATVEDVIAHPRFPHMHSDPDVLRAAVAAARPETHRELIDTVMSTWARQHGKVRWGDKVPGYLGAIPLLDRHFPDAQFVHIIRDGREVAASLAERPWGPPDPVTGALWWRYSMRKRRSVRRRLPPERYHEIRLERLAADPEVEIRRLCDFLGEEYDDEMLRYHERLREDELPEHRRNLLLPPTPRLRNWEDGMSERDRQSVEAICRPDLVELGYPTGPRSTRAYVRAVLICARSLGRQLPRSVWRRLHPRTRRY